MGTPETGIEKKREGVTLDEAIEITGYGKYSYLVVLTAGMNVCGSIFATTLLSYVIPATDCDLALRVSEKGILASMMFTGMIFTSHLMGYLADQYGRKYVCTRCNLLSSLLTLVTAFCPGFVPLSIVTFFNGTITAGVIIPSYVYLGETIPNKYRPISTLFCGAIGNIGSAILPALAIFLIPMTFQWDVFGFFTFRSWRLLVIATSIPPLVGAAMYLMLHESPKYLLTKGYEKETLDALQGIFSMNTGRPREEFPLSSPPRLDGSEVSGKDGSGFKKIWMQTALLFQKPLRGSTIMACILQAGILGVCNVYSLWLPQIVTQLLNFSDGNPELGVTMCHVIRMKNDPMTDIAAEHCQPNVPVTTYKISALIGICQFSFFIVAGGLSQITGNKALLVTSLLACSTISCVLTVVQNMHSMIVIMAASNVLLATGIPISIAMVMDLFPTSIRSTASCICMVVGRIACSMLTQLMGLAQQNYCAASYLAIGAFLGFIGFLALFCLSEGSKTNSKNLISRAFFKFANAYNQKKYEVNIVQTKL